MMNLSALGDIDASKKEREKEKEGEERKDREEGHTREDPKGELVWCSYLCWQMPRTSSIMKIVFHFKSLIEEHRAW